MSMCKENASTYVASVKPKENSSDMRNLYTMLEYRILMHVVYRITWIWATGDIQ